MNEGNKRLNIEEELKRAHEARDAAQLLASNGFITDAISRLYYWVLHSVRALLLSKGLEPKTHEGALTLLGLHFVKTGILRVRDSHTFAKLMKYRQEADYNPSYVFHPGDYEDFRKDAERRCKFLEKTLRKMGYLD